MAHPAVRPGPHVLITISDSGIGMDETKQQMFEPFFTTKGPASGAGLGMAVVYGIIGQSDGDIQVSSAVGQGTAITISLPQAQEEVPASRVAPPEPEAAHGVETLLVVENDDDVREMVRDILGAAGYTVRVAANGQEALTLLAREPEPIALVVTDLVMPVMGGRALAERLTISHPATRFLFMSGYADEENALAMEGSHDTFFIRKPYPVAELIRQVRMALDS